MAALISLWGEAGTVRVKAAAFVRLLRDAAAVRVKAAACIRPREAAEAKHADQEVQAMVRQVYGAVLEERVLMRYHLWKLTVRTPLLLLARLLEFVAREARLEGLLVGCPIAGTIPAGKWD